jgi:hypothetical protein
MLQMLESSLFERRDDLLGLRNISVRDVGNHRSKELCRVVAYRRLHQPQSFEVPRSCLTQKVAGEHRHVGQRESKPQLRQAAREGAFVQPHPAAPS